MNFDDIWDWFVTIISGAVMLGLGAVMLGVIILIINIPAYIRHDAEKRAHKKELREEYIVLKSKESLTSEEKQKIILFELKREKELLKAQKTDLMTPALMIAMSGNQGCSHY